MNTGSILLFGRLKDAFGASSIPLPEGATSAADLRAKLAAANPDLASLLQSRNVRIAVNQKLVADEAAQAVSPRDEIALLPPLSGG
ncbi:MAG: MoaD/ThiS family protein [Alphaproteobacteria bacterium]|nr:MoaD/ThiS family protein [Alphaproteobacteria bacterium]